MTFTKRERFLLIATCVVVGGLLLFTQVLGPLLDARAQAKADRIQWSGKLNQARLTMRLSDNMKVKWQKMIDEGMKADREEAERQVNWAIQQWAGRASLKVTSFGPKERSTGNPLVPERAFRLVGEGSMRAVGDFLLRMETARFPLRIQRVDVNCPKAGTTNLMLTVTIEFSTLYTPAGGLAGPAVDVQTASTGGSTR